MGEVSINRWQASDTELVAALTDAEVRLRQAYSEMLSLLAEVDCRGVAPNLGYSNTPALLVHVLRVSRTDARRRLVHAAELHDQTTPTGAVVEAALPQTADALARGDIGVEHVEVIRKTLAGLPQLVTEKRVEAERVLLEQAAEDDPRVLARFAARVRDMVDPDGPPPPVDEPVRSERELRRHIKRDGTLEFSGRLDAESAQLFEAVLAPFDKSDPGVEDHRGYAERAGDAFVDVLKMAGNSPELPTHNGVKAEVALTVSWETLRDALDDVVLPGDSGLTVGEARRIACDSHILPAVMNGNSKPVDVAVPAYVVPAHIRRALVLRDRGCTFPACDRPASTCDSHHIQSWLRGGPTKLDNLVLLCGSHHRLLHRSAWSVALVEDQAVFTPPAYVDPQQRPRRNGLRRPPSTVAA